MLTSANVIMVSGHGRGFSVQKNHGLIGVLAGQDRNITQSYSNFGLIETSSAWQVCMAAAGGASMAIMWPLAKGDGAALRESSSEACYVRLPPGGAGG
jgi:hypothetical protein